MILFLWWLPRTAGFLIPWSLEDLACEMAETDPPARRSEMEVILGQLAAAISGNQIRTPAGGQFTALKENFTVAGRRTVAGQTV